jgi:hypothetical protein
METTMKSNVEIEITTEQMSDGSFSWSFQLAGLIYSDNDMSSMEAAVQDAKSIARLALNHQRQ